MNNYTPGPWSIHAQTGSGYVGLIRGANGAPVAIMQPGRRREFAGEPHDPDARLIIAALALKAAADDALATLVALAAHLAPNGKPWSECPELMKSARLLRDAIAKAEGRS